MSFEWKMTPLPDLLSFIVDNRGKTVPTSDNGRKLIATNCVRNDNLYPIYEKVRYLSDETYKTWFRSHPIPGDILFVNKGTPGRVCMVPDPVDFCIAQDMIAFRTNKRMYNKFLFAVLRSSEMQTQIYNTNVGDVIPHFKKSFLDQILIPEPDMKIQKEIGDMYFSLSKKIDLNNRINTNLEAQTQAIFKSWFVDFEPFQDGEFVDSELGRIPKGWNLRPLYEFADYINGAAFKKIEYSIDGSGTPIIKIVELKNGITPSTQYCCIEKEQKYYIDNKEILFSWSGNPDTSIDTFIWYRGKAILNQHTFRVLPREQAYCFVYCLLKHCKPLFTQIARNKQTTGLGHVTVKDLKENLFVYSKDSIRDFCSIVNPLIEKMYINYKQNHTLAALRDTLVPKLMSGEIEVPVEEILL